MQFIQSMQFIQLVKSIMEREKIGLRELARRSGVNAGYLSRVLSKIEPPFQDLGKLEIIANSLNIEKGSDEYYKLFDYAKVDGGRLPEYVKNREEVMSFLPAFFRTIDNKKPTKEQLEKLMKDIEHSLDNE